MSMSNMSISLQLYVLMLHMSENIWPRVTFDSVVEQLRWFGDSLRLLRHVQGDPCVQVFRP